MQLENIGFYTLSDERAKNSSEKSSLVRCELILTDRCNLKCLYCKGVKPEFRGDMPYLYASKILDYWIKQGLQNVRFSGGEPTLYEGLPALVDKCKKNSVKRIALSTNGTHSLDYYKALIEMGVNDFSISLDGGCCSTGRKMSGGNERVWYKASEAIKELSKLTYVTVGMVFNELNCEEAGVAVNYVNRLNPSDIRILSSAQYNKALSGLSDINKSIIEKYKILNYRLNNFKKGRNVRGLRKTDCGKCKLVLDDVAVIGKYHFPCIIYLREGGKPIGKMRKNFREERLDWYKNHNSFKDRICKDNCLDVCIDYNNKCEFYG